MPDVGRLFSFLKRMGLKRGICMDFLDCMEFDKALALVRSSLDGRVVGAEWVELADALDRVTAEEIRAEEELPAFSRSTVDGYAVRSEDTFGANESAAAMLALVGEIGMGRDTELTVRPGEAVSIPTGGMLPPGADAAVMLDYTEQPDSQTVLVQRTVSPGENIIARGEDIAVGAVAVAGGVRLEPHHIGFLAACGCHRLRVRKKIRVSLISSGDELVEIQERPSPGQIRDVNSYSLAALLMRFGCEVRRLGIVKDGYEHFLDRLSSAVASSELVVISGGSSVGVKDFTVPAIRSLGEPGILVHGLAVKPGKPTIFAMIGKVPVFGLPGHPVAALTICSQLVAAAVRQMSGCLPKLGGGGISAVMARNVASAPGRDDFVQVRLVAKDSGFLAEPVFGKSGLISIMNRADGVVRIPASKSGLYEGETVLVQRTGTAWER